jgi:hypothetical protein
LASFNEALRNAVRQGFCSIIGTNLELVDFFGAIGLPNQVLGLESQRNYVRLNCNTEPPPPSPGAPFSGGQCPVGYGVQSSIRVLFEGAPFAVDNFDRPCSNGPILNGPITGPVARSVGGVSGFFLDGFDEAGDPESLGLVNGRTGPGYTFEVIAINVTRCDGLADDCGDPGGGGTPAPNYNIIDTDITYTNNDGLDITIPTNIVYVRPTLDVDANIQVPVRITIRDPQLNIDVPITAKFNLSTGDIVFNVGGELGNDGRKSPCATEPDPRTTFPAPPPGSGIDETPPPDDPEEERIIRAVVVTSNEVSARSSVIGTTAGVPNIYVPAMGYIHFEIRAGQRTAWLDAIPVKNQRHFIPVPWSGGAIAVRYTPFEGTLSTVTPIFGVVDAPLENPSG